MSTTATAQGAYAIHPLKAGRAADPYTYQVGFGNAFASEAVPETLPVGQNSPQKSASRELALPLRCARLTFSLVPRYADKFGLYAEQVTATVSPV